jgi:prepilin-type N-terminal cleavage/methylation domain-containing protein
MDHRQGITLIEVLVAMFIAAIGTLSLLVLFPLAALNMRQALVDDRCAQAGINGAALMDSLGYRTDGISSTGAITPGSIADQLVNSQNPVYIDAIGTEVILSTATPTGPNLYVGALGALNAPTPGIQRMTPTFISSAASPPTGNTAVLMAYKFFRLQDDLNYSTVAVADTTGGFINRVGHYTWAYMVRPPSSVYCPGIADMSVVVYDGRNTSTPGGESCYLPAGSTYPVGSTSIVLQYSGTPLPIAGSPYYSQTAPVLRRGSWILDASKFDTNNDPAAIGNIHSFFYRVVDVTDTGTTMQVDLETPLVAAIDGASATTPGIIVVLENVANVYERLTGRLP